MKITALTGGIGAGKSVVSEILRIMGYDVFDCDSEAKLLMDRDEHIKARLVSEIHNSAVDENGIINRPLLSQIVFSDPEKLNKLNHIVHSAVRKRIKEWACENHRQKHLFVETAILYQSGLDHDVDDVIEVIAPLETRIERVMKRNSCDEASVISRINSQQFSPENKHPRVTYINNDGFIAVMPQIISYLNAETGK